ncbi:MAG: chromosome segregation protein SMC, partial [Pseudomonadota bacterium]
PLLQLLWPDATLLWDDKELLPTALVRKGQEEPIDVLSGGTKEQVSLLVRLAFARMLAKRGQSAPIILDDALVFTDDDRIERMFDALHEQASDLQILVLSCRQRAFRELGGNVLHLE